MLRGQTGTYLVSGNGARWVSLQGVIGGANLVGQPGLHGAITREQQGESFRLKEALARSEQKGVERCARAAKSPGATKNKKS